MMKKTVLLTANATPFVYNDIYRKSHTYNVRLFLKSDGFLLQAQNNIKNPWWRHKTETFSVLLVTKASDAELWCFLWSAPE